MFPLNLPGDTPAAFILNENTEFPKLNWETATALHQLQELFWKRSWFWGIFPYNTMQNLVNVLSPSSNTSF